MKQACSAITLPISITWKNEKNYVNEKYGQKTDNTCNQTANTHLKRPKTAKKKGNQEQKINKITDVYILSANEQARYAEKWRNAHDQVALSVSSARQRNNIQSWPGSGISNRTQMHTITLIKRQMREMPKLQCWISFFIFFVRFIFSFVQYSSTELCLELKIAFHYFACYHHFVTE